MPAVIKFPTSDIAFRAFTCRTWKLIAPNITEKFQREANFEGFRSEQSSMKFNKTFHTRLVGYLPSQYIQRLPHVCYNPSQKSLATLRRKPSPASPLSMLLQWCRLLFRYFFEPAKQHWAGGMGEKEATVQCYCLRLLSEIVVPNLAPYIAIFPAFLPNLNRPRDLHYTFYNFVKTLEEMSNWEWRDRLYL